jgi:hypothetical protein
MAGPYEFVVGKFNAIHLTPREAEILDKQLEVLFGPDKSVIKDIVGQYRNHIRAFIEIMKNELQNPLFKGLTPDPTDLGFTTVRPAHLGMSSWEVTYSAAGWQTVASGQMNEDAGVLIFGIYSVGNKDVVTDGIKFTVGNKTLMPLDLTPLSLGDNENNVKVWTFPAIPITPKQTYTIELHAKAAGTDEVAFLGVTAGLGRYLSSTF